MDRMDVKIHSSLSGYFYPSNDDSGSGDGRSSCSGFAKFNMIPGATGVTGTIPLIQNGQTGITGDIGVTGMQTFAFSTSTVHQSIMMIDVTNNNNIIVNKEGWYSLDFQYTLINDPTFVTGLYYYTGIMINGIIQVDSRRYEYMIPPSGPFTGVSNPKSTLFVYLSKGSVIRVFFDCGGAMPLTLKPLTGAVLNVIKLS
jgi:hypothetical protein